MSYSVYIGGSTNESTLVYLIPLIKNILKEYKISHFIFEKNITNQVVLNSIRRNLDTSITILDDKLSILIITKYLLKFICYRGIESIFKIILDSNRYNILKTSHNYSLRHAILDTSNLYINEDSLRCSKFNYFKTFIKVFLSYQRGVYLSTKNLILVYTAHTVYQYRALICGISENCNVKYFMSNYGPSVYFFDPHNETNQYLLKKIQWKNFIDCCTKKDILGFWRKRITIGSSYNDSNRAMKGDQVVPSDYPKNVLFLHVFKDSPFNHLDKNRIFSDYIDWIESSLNILKSSNENWALRIHPSANLWGECSQTILKTLLRKSFGKSYSENILIDNSSFSNISILKHASRIITYSGTVHLEAASLGIRPIVISKCPLSSYSNQLVHYPKTLDSYESMLLRKSNDTCFKINEKDSNIAKSILFLIEEKLNFKKELFGKYLYRNSSSIDAEEDLTIILNKFKDSQSYLKNLSFCLKSTGITLNDEFCEILKKNYVKI